jgi:GTPase SAR1 family protein
MDRNVFGVAILGQSGVGKSSLIKRMVSHRFDNMPTLNEQFMGNKLDGRHVMAITMPAPFTAASASTITFAGLNLGECC